MKGGKGVGNCNSQFRGTFTNDPTVNSLFSCRPLRRPWLKRLSRGGRFRKLLETYMLSNCGWLIKEKKRRRGETWIPVTFIVDACASKCVHAQQIYIIRQEFALPPSSSFPNISNLYSIVETSDI